MVSILTESGFSGSNWCKAIKDSLVEQLRIKRIPFDEAKDILPYNTDGVFIIASDYKWIKSAVTQLNRSSIQPIVICNQLDHIPGCVYSCVCSDINGSMKELLDNIAEKGKKRIAVYGVNPNSISDISRVDSLYVWRDQRITHMEVFTNNGSLENCFKNFSNKLSMFDTVICSNNYAAISLVRSLRRQFSEVPNGLEIISCVRTEISDYYSDCITSLDINCEQYGRAAVSLFESLKKAPYLCSVTMHVKPTFQSSKAPVMQNDLSLDFAAQDSFYEDEELKPLLTADRILNAADHTDRKLLRGIINGKSYATLCEECFMAESSIKYRIKKLTALCPTRKKEELIQIVKEYIKNL